MFLAVIMFCCISCVQTLSLVCCCFSAPVEAIEMTTLTNMSDRWPCTSSMTPPVLCSSRASESSGSGSGRRVALTPADSMEYIRKLIKDYHSSGLPDKSRCTTGSDVMTYLGQYTQC